MLFPNGMGCSKALTPWEARVGKEKNKVASVQNGLATWGQMNVDQKCTPPSSSPPWTACNQGQNMPVMVWQLDCREKGHNDINGKKSINWRLHSNTLTDLLTKDLVSSKYSKETLNINPRITDVILESKQGKPQMLSFKRVVVIRSV